jgi:hypothetical protein
MAELIASGTAEAASADFTLADGQTAMLQLKAPTAAGQRVFEDSKASVQAKDAGGNYLHIGYLTKELPAQILSGPGTFRVVRLACTNATGVDKS